MDQSFSHYRAWSNWSAFDLYFIGLKRGAQLDAEVLSTWDRAAKAIDEYVTRVNQLKVCRYRALVARFGGDNWFVKMRDIVRLLDYVHGG